MEVSGSIVKIEQTQMVGSNNFKKRVLVIKTVEQYPQFISITFTKDKCDELNMLHVGQMATVYINLRGREYNGKYFNDIEGWRIVAAAPGTKLDDPDVIPF